MRRALTALLDVEPLDLARDLDFFRHCLKDLIVGKFGGGQGTAQVTNWVTHSLQTAPMPINPAAPIRASTPAQKPAAKSSVSRATCPQPRPFCVLLHPRAESFPHHDASPEPCSSQFAFPASFSAPTEFGNRGPWVNPTRWTHARLRGLRCSGHGATKERGPTCCYEIKHEDSVVEKETSKAALEI